MNTSTPVITRIAPSPTGLLHIGTARTALFNYLYARKHGGRFLIRIEDTDRERSTMQYEQNILEGLQRLGLEADGEIIRQSERVERHTACLQQLVTENKAYISREPARDDPTREVEVVRLRNNGAVITFRDEVRGDITFDTTELGDMVIARNIHDPLYHFAVVVDDADMGVTHVIRGDDHISNTPRQILIQEALDFPRPVYTHLPLILATDRSKMSKRKGAVAISAYLEEGYLPETLVNFLALMGWNDGTDKEVYRLPELVEAFSIEGIQKSGAVFDVEKLKWLNREHRKRLPEDTVRTMLLTALHDQPVVAEIITRSVPAYEDLLERYATTGDMCKALAEGEYDFYNTRPMVTREALVWKKDPEPEKAGERLSILRARLLEISTETFLYDEVKSAVWDFAEQEGRGQVLWPLRYALSGREKSPDPFLLLEALGKEESLARIDTAIAILTQYT
ncbi:MAG: glutamate--tRNA ligase [Candidatus Pacebacteria bacterium]|nr:glutamate--tRNA ligase [Candidatus Paceibacterota bacterium]